MKCVFLSDIHLGHRRTPTKHIVTNLNKWFKKHRKAVMRSDLLILSGDVYDRLLYIPSEEAVLAMNWLISVVKYCSVNNIKLRILEGTPSHDWKQCAILKDIIEELDIAIDFKYIDTVMVEHLPEYDKTILYVPDEWKPTTQETMADVEKVLKDNNLTQVDLGVIHGQFRHQLPVYKEEHVFDEEEWSRIVKSFAVVGHIHLPSAFGKILTPGSFDRLAHGEEHAKGGLYIEVGTDPVMVRLPNDSAMIYKTVDLRGFEGNLIELLDSEACALQEGSYVRLMVDSSTGSVVNMDALKRRYRHLHLSKKGKDIKKDESRLDEIRTELLATLSINNNTIESLMSARLKNEPDIDLDYSVKLFKKFI